MNKQGFTLAEVLVTMGIIGVVAAITMPTLTGSSNSKQLQAQFNTAHSLLSQAVYTIAGQKGFMPHSQKKMKKQVKKAITKTKMKLEIYCTDN